MVEKRFEKLGMPDIERFENYLPTAFNSELTLLQKVNKLIFDLMETNKLTNEMVDYLNNFIKTFDEKLYKTLEDVLKKWLDDGVLENLINEIIFKIGNIDNFRPVDDLLINKIKNDSFEHGVNIMNFQNKNKSKSFDELFLEALNALPETGGCIYIPNKLEPYIIKNSMNVNKIGVTIKTESPIVRLIVDKNFNNKGYIFNFERPNGEHDLVNKGINIETGFELDLNNVFATPFIFKNIYDQSRFENIALKNINSDFIGFDFRQDDEPYIPIGQTLILENCMGEHYSANEDTKPIFSFYQYQEINLIGCKAFVSPAHNDINNVFGIGYEFINCQGVTMLGCSSAVCGTGIKIKSTINTYQRSGFTILGQTNERMSGYAVDVEGYSNTKNINNIYVSQMRYEGEYHTNGLTNAIKLRNCTNSIFNTLITKFLIDDGTKGCVFVGSKPSELNTGKLSDNVSQFINLGENIFNSLSLAGNVPQFKIKTPLENYQIINNLNATDEAFFGYSLDYKSKSEWVKLLNFNYTDINFKTANNVNVLKLIDNPKVNHVGLSVGERVDGVTVLKDVKFYLDSENRKILYIE